MLTTFDKNDKKQNANCVAPVSILLFPLKHHILVETALLADPCILKQTGCMVDANLQVD